MKDFTKRLLTGVLIIAVIILIPLYFKNYGIIAISAFLSIIGLGEFFSIFKDEKIEKIRVFLFLQVLIYYLLSAFNIYDAEKLFFAILTLSLMIIFLFDRNIDSQSITRIFTGFLYVPFLFSHLLNQNNPEAFYLVFVIAFATDTFAYLGGFLFGRHKLWYEVSPKKTIEGAISGIFGAVLISGLFRYFIFRLDFDIFFVIFIVFASVFSQLGDLVASIWKRKYGVKDYGKIFPGHGGVLDRFDSVLFVAPIVHYYYLFLI